MRPRTEIPAGGGLQLPERIESVQTPIIPVVAELIRQTPGTLSLGQGVVSYGPPEASRKWIERFFENRDNHKYQAVDGIPELKERLAEKLLEENKIRLGGENRLAVTAGSNLAFVNAVFAVSDPGDEIILFRPCYFNHEMAVTLAGCRPVLAETTDDYQPDLDDLAAKITPRTRAVVTVSPNNPSGASYPRETLAAVNRMCGDRGIYHINDEAYEYFHYDGSLHFSPACLPGSEGHTISLFSFSKAFGFASWRVGYMVMPERLHAPVKKIQDTLLICPPVISQFAAIGALEAGRPWVEERIGRLAETRREALEELNEHGDLLETPVTRGAFYILSSVRAEVEPMVLVERLIREHRIAVIPGTAFGITDRCSLRMSYGPLEPGAVREATRRLTRGLREILGAGAGTAGR